MGGGGGGDSGAAKREEKRRLEEEERAKAAVDRVNSLFGIGGDASLMTAPDINDYTRQVWTNGTISPGMATTAAARELMAGGSPFSNGYSQSAPGVTIRNGVTYYDQPVTLQPYDVSTKRRVGGRNGHWENSVKTVTPPGMYQTSLVDDAFNQANFAYQRGAALRSRNQLYDTVSNDAFNFHRQRLDDDRDQAERSLRFQLARQGQFGGSLDVDQNSELSKGYNNGLVDARNMADAARNDASARDDQTRIDLINRINAGMDAGSAIASANSQMQSNINQARDNALSQSLGDAFGNVALLKKQWDYQQGMDDIMKRYPNYFTQGGNNGTVRG